jgi:hypothetical protein
MKFEIPKIVKPLRLADYDPAFGEAAFQVWVNPPRSSMAHYWQLSQQAVELKRQLNEPETDKEEIIARMERVGKQILAWFGEIWSQGDEATRWTEAEIEELYESSRDTDPQLWPWLAEQTLAIITEHRSAQKKG